MFSQGRLDALPRTRGQGPLTYVVRQEERDDRQGRRAHGQQRERSRTTVSFMEKRTTVVVATPQREERRGDWRRGDDQHGECREQDERSDDRRAVRREEQDERAGWCDVRQHEHGLDLRSNGTNSISVPNFTLHSYISGGKLIRFVFAYMTARTHMHTRTSFI